MRSDSRVRTVPCPVSYANSTLSSFNCLIHRTYQADTIGHQWPLEWDLQVLSTRIELPMLPWIYGLSSEVTMTQSTAETPPPKPKQTPSRSAKKWGKEAWEVGHTSVPTILFQAQHRLGLDSVHLCILLQLADFWWDSGRKPFPTVALLSQRIGLCVRHVRRVLKALEEAGFITRIERRAPGRGKISNEYDLSGLVSKLSGLAPEFQKVKDDARARRAELIQPAWARAKPSIQGASPPG
jgi:hypothetical protein